MAKSLMQEGLHRFKAHGVVDVVVETGDMIPANLLYGGIGFTKIHKDFYWLRRFE